MTQQIYQIDRDMTGVRDITAEELRRVADVLTAMGYTCEAVDMARNAEPMRYAIDDRAFYAAVEAVVASR